MLIYLEDSEDLKVGVTELWRKQVFPSGKLLSRQGMRTAKRFLKFSGKEKKMHVLPAGPNGTRSYKVWLSLKEVKLLSERQEVLKGIVEDKIRLQSRATEKYHEQIVEEMKELEEKKSKEDLLHVQKKSHLRYQNERNEAKRLQRSGELERDKEGGGLAGPSLL